MPGYRKDVKSLCHTFWSFGYDLRIYTDLTALGLRQTVKNLAKEKIPKTKDSIFKDYQSLVVCILSHGGPGSVYGVDNIPVNVSELQWAFNAEHCELQGKAKIFFVQACQGGKEQNCLEISYTEVLEILKNRKEIAKKRNITNFTKLKIFHEHHLII